MEESRSAKRPYSRFETDAEFMKRVGMTQMDPSTRSAEETLDVYVARWFGKQRRIVWVSP